MLAGSIMENVILVIALVLIVGGAIAYIYKAKMSGQKCVGCPYAKECGKGKCSCSSKDDNEA